MLDVKIAVETALQTFKDLFPGSYHDVALEEVELDETTSRWIVTIGFMRHNTRDPFGVTGLPSLREYKVIELGAESGQLVSVKIRKP